MSSVFPNFPLPPPPAVAPAPLFNAPHQFTGSHPLPFGGHIHPQHPDLIFPSPPNLPPQGFHGGFRGGFCLPPPQNYCPPGPHWYPRGRGRGARRSPAHFECKACNKEYRMMENYTAHIQSHQKCSECDFSALPRVLKVHQQIHIMPDMLKFSSPEEIRKWREERRKNFPTAENVARKKKLLEEKKDRGETAMTPLYRYVRQLIGQDFDDRPRRGRYWKGGGRGRGHFRGRRRGGFRGRGSGRGNWQKGSGSEVDMSSEEREMSLGAEKEYQDKETVSQDYMDKETVHQDSLDKETVHQDGLDKGTIHQDKLDKETLHQDGLDKGTIHQDGMDKDTVSHQGVLQAILADAAGQKHMIVKDKCETSMGRANGQRKRSHNWASRRELKKMKKMKYESIKLEDVRARKPTLLEKLLAPEIRQEQNTILQCIRYIVRNGFLGHQSGDAAGSKSCDQWEGKNEVDSKWESENEVCSKSCELQENKVDSKSKSCDLLVDSKAGNQQESKGDVDCKSPDWEMNQIIIHT